jgi:hypothetical protein
MLEWIIENTDWLFSGIAIAVPLAIIGWLWGRRGKGDTNIGSHNRAGRDQFTNAPDYQLLIADIAETKEDLRDIPADKISRRLQKGEKLAALRKQLEGFKENVFRLYEQFNRTPINTERLRQIMECDQVSEEQAIAAQMPLADKARLADHLIDNSAGWESSCGRRQRRFIPPAAVVHRH